MEDLLLARIEHYRVKADRIRQKPLHNEERLYGQDLDWFRLNTFGFRGVLPPPCSGEHWIWSGQTTDGGSPVMRVKDRRLGAARAAYATWCRPLKPNERVRSACGKPLCVNPAHLTARGDKAGDEWLHDRRHESTAKRALDSNVDDPWATISSNL